jgi:hypothetical protein
MSMKKTDMTKSLASKIGGQIRNSVTPDRFSQGANGATTKREQRKIDAQAGLVPFACKLPADLIAQLHAHPRYSEGMNALVAHLLSQSIHGAPY